MEVNALKKSTLSEQIMEQIASKIVSGELSAGEKLPTERDFAAMFNVTRNRVREALRALSLIGMIVIKPGGGSFVANSDSSIPSETVSWMYHKELENVDDIYDARKLIESEVYLSFFDNLDNNKLDECKNLFSKISSVKVRKISAEEFLQLLTDMDLYIGSNCGNGVYTKLMQTIILLRKDSAIKILNVPGSMKSAIKSREKIVQAMENGDREELVIRLEEFYRDSLENLH
jgi:DNA-binding FadR family transcriptional regulator